jgi:plastocyanin
MKTIRSLAAVMLVLSLVAIVQSCSSHSDKGTNPPPALELNSPSISQGGQYVHTFTAVGTYNYKCSFHSSMTGTVTVTTGAPATPLAISIVSMAAGYSPSSPTVGVGSVVTWTNNDPNAGAVGVHTVTSTP